MLTYIRPPGYAIRPSGPSEFTVTYQGEIIGRTTTRGAAAVIRARHARRNVVDGWMVRHVSSGSHGPACPVRGTRAVVTVDCMSDNDMIKTVNSVAERQGRPDDVGPYPISDIGYRWCWESFTPDGHRTTETIIATPVR